MLSVVIGTKPDFYKQAHCDDRSITTEIIGVP